MSHRPTLAATVEWEADTPTDVTGRLVRLTETHGGSIAAIERPLAAPAAGHATLDIDDVEGRTARYPLRVTSDGVKAWDGWISEPDFVDLRRRTRWRLTGRSAETLEEQVALSRPAGSTTATMAAVAAVTLSGLTDRNHRIINLKRPAGDLLSTLAGALNAELLERLDGSLLAIARRPTARPAGTVTINAAEMFVGVDLESRDEAQRIRNVVEVQTMGPSTPHEQETFTGSGSIGWPGRSARNGAAITWTVRVALPDDGRTYSSPAALLVSARVRWAHEDTGRDTPNLTGTPITTDVAPYVTVGAVTISGREIVVPLTLAARRPPAPTASPRHAPWGVGAGINEYWWWRPRRVTNGQHAVGLYATVSAVASAAGTPTPAAFTVVENADSIARWGRRELRRPPWLIESAANGTALLEALAQLRRSHRLILPLQQPTPELSARVAALDAGDYVTLHIVDAARGVNLPDTHALITERTLEINNVGEGFVEVNCLETGTGASRDLLKWGDDVLLWGTDRLRWY